MNKFSQAVQGQQNEALTFNDGATNYSSLSNAVDFFARIGNRNVNVTKEFEKALRDSKDVAYRTLLWGRDVREGAGERETVRNLLLYLEKQYSEDLLKILPYIPEMGRWDDLLIFETPKVQNEAFRLIKNALWEDANALCAKWMPRKGLKAVQLAAYLGYRATAMAGQKKSGKIIVEVSMQAYGANVVNVKKEFPNHKALKKWKRRHQKKIAELNVISESYDASATPRLGGSVPHKGYRKLLSCLSKTIETQMCAKEWGNINYNHVPSLAAARYQRAFDVNDNARYQEYRNGLKTGKTTIKAGAVYPYDVLKSLDKGIKDVAVAQWEALPDYIGDSGERIIPMIDVSASMTWSNFHRLEKANINPIDVAVSLGLYVADKQQGHFKDMALTFSTRPSIEILKGDISQKVETIKRMHWQGSTNVYAAFEKILEVAKSNSVPASEMPTMLLVFSDMEFDRCVQDGQNTTAYDYFVKSYHAAGYEPPKIVFWCLNGSSDNFPVTYRENGTALVSGFSPAIMKSLLSGKLKEFSPEAVMLETVMEDRYKIEGISDGS